MIDSADNIFGRFQFRPPANSDVVAACRTELPFDLPQSYWRFMSISNGGDGFVGPTFIRIWKVEELVSKNRMLGIFEKFPPLTMFGDNGAGEGLTFDVRTLPMRVLYMPFISLSMGDGVIVSPSFETLFEAIYRDEVQW